MINELLDYRLSGLMAGYAANSDDWSAVQRQRNWLTDALAQETKEYAATARNTWSLAYSEARHE